MEDPKKTHCQTILKAVREIEIDRESGRRVRTDRGERVDGGVDEHAWLKGVKR
jgi:hypothetical protein